MATTAADNCLMTAVYSRHIELAVACDGRQHPCGNIEYQSRNSECKDDESGNSEYRNDENGDGENREKGRCDYGDHRRLGDNCGGWAGSALR